MSEEINPLMKPSQIISKSFVSNEYNLYLHGEISHNADEYLEHFAVYHQATGEDLIRLWIQSPGGSVSVGDQYIKHMKRCQAPIVAVIGMGTASEATAISLAADEWEVDEMSTFLVHGFSYGAYGHEAQVYNTATFNKKLNEKSLRLTYSGFLTEEEIQEALKGVDLLFDGEELSQRLVNYKEYRQSQPCNCGDPNCGVDSEEDEEPEITLEDIISNAVEKGIQEGLGKILKKYDLTEKPKKTSAKVKPDSVTVAGDVVVNGSIK